MEQDIHECKYCGNTYGKPGWGADYAEGECCRTAELEFEIKRMKFIIEKCVILLIRELDEGEDD